MKCELIAELTLSDELSKEIAPLLKSLVSESLKEKGCLRYEAYRKEGAFVIIEAWENHHVLEEHKLKNHFTELVNFVEVNNVGLEISELAQF